jgi:hypothetical protein
VTTTTHPKHRVSLRLEGTYFFRNPRKAFCKVIGHVSGYNASLHKTIATLGSGHINHTSRGSNCRVAYIVWFKNICRVRGFHSFVQPDLSRQQQLKLT